MLQTIYWLTFFFLLGTCVGSFLNVVVYRLPRIEYPQGTRLLRELWLTIAGLSDPPSHCPHCDRRLKWYDNIPVLGWVKLGGKCRFCRKPFSVRYAVVELFTGLMFGGLYYAYFVLQWRHCCPVPQSVRYQFDAIGFLRPIYHSEWNLSDAWPIFGLYLALLSALLAASLIDAATYTIPIQIPWLMAVAGVIVHGAADRPNVPGSLWMVPPAGDFAALAAGGTIGLVISVALLTRGVLPLSFVDGEVLEVDRESAADERARANRAGETTAETELPEYTRGQVRREIGKEILFLLPPLVLAAIAAAVVHFTRFDLGMNWVVHTRWLNAALASCLGAMVGGFIVWVVRIMGSLALGRVAMGLGDVHLMFGVGAVLGGTGAGIAFFIAPAFGILAALYLLIAKRRRETPLGPFLSMATAVVMLSYCPIAEQLRQALEGLLFAIRQ